jgi:hypothetical protein
MIPNYRPTEMGGVRVIAELILRRINTDENIWMTATDGQVVPFNLLIQLKMSRNPSGGPDNKMDLVSFGP